MTISDLFLFAGLWCWFYGLLRVLDGKRPYQSKPFDLIALNQAIAKQMPDLVSGSATCLPGGKFISHQTGEIFGADDPICVNLGQLADDDPRRHMPRTVYR